MTKQELLEQFGANNPQKFGSGGWLYLVDTMGDDQAICQAARISYGAGTKSVTEDKQLIRYLVNHHHTSPLEQCEIKLHIRLSIDTWRQMVRHRTANVNEYSTRYSIAIDDMMTAQTWRSQSKDNKQGSGEAITAWPFPISPEREVELLALLGSKANILFDLWTEAEQLGLDINQYLSSREQQLQDLAREVYLERLALGVAREQARKDLPMSTYTEVYYKQDLHNLLHFMWLRTDPHAQQEIREIANLIGKIVEAWCPYAYMAWCDFKRDTISLSAPEQEALNLLTTAAARYEFNNKLDSWNKDPETRAKILGQAKLTSKTERKDFIRKIKRLLGV
jgi:thymidylate synthase (FAD)